MPYYPVSFTGFFHKPWNKDPVIKQQASMEGNTGVDRRSGDQPILVPKKGSL